MSENADTGNLLGSYLRDRRSKLDPAALGLSQARRRTPGLRREEVAQRASISPTWYTWLEQGRGGAPSAEVLDRLASALLLTDLEREHLFLIGLGRPPEARYRKGDGVSSRLQRVLDALEPSPALIRTATWDVVAWNRAAPVMLTDYGALPPGQRNILRSIFLDPQSREMQVDWESVARFVLGAVRLETARAGAGDEIRPLIEELCRLSPEFEAMWAANDIPTHGGGAKHLRHPLLGTVSFEYSTFAVDGRSDLSLIVYNPVDAGDLERICELMTAREEPPAHESRAAAI